MEIDLFQALRAMLVTRHNTSRCGHLKAGLLRLHLDTCIVTYLLFVFNVLVVLVSVYVFIAFEYIELSEGSGVDGGGADEDATAAAEPRDKDAKKQKFADSEKVQPNVKLSQGTVIERRTKDGI